MAAPPLFGEREIKVGTTKVRVFPLDCVTASKRAVLPVLEDVLRTIKEARPARAKAK